MGDHLRRKAIKILAELGKTTTSRETLFQDLVETLESVVYQSKVYSSYIPQGIRKRIIDTNDSVKLSGERRMATIMFIDVCGFTTISEQLDPEKVIDLLNRVFDVIVKSAKAHGGSVDKFLGDAALISFGAPIARGDDPTRALLTALEIQHQMKDLSFEDIRINNKPVSFQVSIGIHTGLVIADNVGTSERREYTVIGDSVNTASRLRDLARPGDIVVSETTRKNVRELFAFTPIGECSLKGRENRVRAFLLGAHVQRLQQSTRLQSGCFVGRQTELARLNGNLDDVMNGTFRSLHFQGNAGIGKTRLINHWVDSLTDRPVSIIRQSSFFEFRDSQLTFIRNIITTALNLELESRGNDKLTRRIAAIIRVFGGNRFQQKVISKNIVQYLQLDKKVTQGFDEEARKSLVESIVSILGLISANKPVLFILDNYQWADQASQWIIKKVSQQMSSERVFLLIASRAELPDPELCSESFVLQGLGQDAARDLIKYFTQSFGIQDISPDSILNRAKDHPLFIELLLRHIFEQRTIKTTASESLPMDIQSAILALIDNLGEDVRKLIHAAAVIGDRIYPDILSMLLHENREQTNLLLTDLSEAGYIQFHPVQSVYHFQQDLIREVIYDTILLKTRSRWHQKIGLLMEEQQDSKRFTPEILAYHFRKGSDPEKGLYYIDIAAQQAGFLHQHDVAVKLYGQAREIIKDNKLSRPADEWKFHFQIGQSMYIQGQLEQAKEHFQAALTLTGESGDLLSRGETLVKLGDICSDLGLLPEAIPYYEEAIELFKDNDESEGEIRVINALSIIYTQVGNFEQAKQAFQRGIERAGESSDYQLAGMIHSNYGIFNSLQNDTESAISAYLSSIYYFEQAGSLEGVAHSYHNLGTTYEKVGDLDTAELYYRRSMKVSSEIDDVAMIGSTLLNRSQLWLKRGDVSLAEALCRQAISRLATLNNPMIRAEAFLTLGQIFTKKENENQARKYFCLAYRINRQCQNIIGLASSAYEFGRILDRQNHKKRAKRYLLIARDAFEKVGDTDGVLSVDAILD